MTAEGVGGSPWRGVGGEGVRKLARASVQVGQMRAALSGSRVLSFLSPKTFPRSMSNLKIPPGPGPASVIPKETGSKRQEEAKAGGRDERR